jgi:cytochrome c oxidase cbb3-type subunit III
MGGINLLRSPLVLADDHGELIYPVVRDGRQTPGMPVMPALQLPEADAKAVAEYIHSIVATSRGQGAPPAGAPVVLNVLVGDAAAGKAYFEQKCTTCHSATGDLAGLGTRISDPMQLQNAWVGGGGGGRGGRGGGAAAAAAGPNRREVRVTVTPATGPKVEGRLDRIDDFLVILTPADGLQRSFRRTGDLPKVEINDPMAGHRALLSGYTDKDMHNVTAYLVTLK